MTITNEQRAARAELLAAVHDAHDKEESFDITSVEDCLLCKYFARSNVKHPPVTRFEWGYLSNLFGLPEHVVSDVFCLRWQDHQGMRKKETNISYHIERLETIFAEHN